MNSLEAQWRDHELRYVEPSAKVLSEDESLDKLRGAFAVARSRIENVTRILSPDSVALAVGPAGQPGDPDRIEHLATRLIDVYSGLLEWSAELRGALVPARYSRAFELASRVVDLPITQFRAFTESVVRETDRIPTWRRDPNRSPLRIELTLTLSLDEAAVVALNHEIDQLNDIANVQ